MMPLRSSLCVTYYVRASATKPIKRLFSNADYISNTDAEFTKKVPISHTPIFSHTLMEFFTKPEHIGKHFQLLDMTFGTGSHTCYILDQFRRAGVKGTITVYASDCDPESYNLARRVISERSYDSKMLVPIKSSFIDLEEKLIKLKVLPSSLSGILIDTGISAMQWANQNRGFCHLRDGVLDLRFDPTQNTPRGYEVLQTIDDTSLLRLLRTYGSLKQNAKHVTNSILEARHMHYEFKTVQELFEVLELGMKNADMPQDPKVITDLLMKTITAVRCFVNDELNQLDYAIRHLAVKYLKPDGILAIIAHTDAEEKVIRKCLQNEVDLDMNEANNEVSVETIERMKNVSWKIHYGEPPKVLPMAEQILYPRLKDSVLFVASRVK